MEPRRLELRRVSVALQRAFPRPIRILQISDLHLSTFVPLRFIQRAVDRGLEESPEIICLTGDFVTAGDRRQDLAAYAGLLRTVAQTAPTFAVLGNHDGGLWSGSKRGLRTTAEIGLLLESAGVVLLRNRSTIVTIGSRRITLVGTGDLWSGEFSPEEAFDGVPTHGSDAVIVLAHNPDTKDAIGSHGWDLMLSGHTHGGQVRFPLVGAPFAPVDDRRYIEGLNPWRDRQIYTSRGVGNIFGLRWNCPPEVTLLEVG